MSRTSCVALMGGSVFFASLLGGCASCSVEPPIDGGPRVFLEVGPDTRDIGNDPVEIVPTSCSVSGAIGGHCRSPAACAPGATCVDLHAGPQNINDAFRLRQSSGPDPVHLDYPLATATLVSPAPFNAAEGTLCAQQCNTSVDDTCGTCTTCSDMLTQMPLVAVLGGARQLFGTGAMFGARTGVCRIDCTFDPATAGDECPTSTTCDAFGATCIEACTSDAECNTNLGITYAGELVTVVDTAHPRVCNLTTGRCEHPTGVATATVGTICTGDDECAATSGVCVSGGHCAQLGCTNPGTSTSTCADAHGICLPASESSHTTGICLQGCNHAADCGTGNSCNLLHLADGSGFTIGTFTGYCIGACTSDDECIAGETCTDTTSGTTVNPGRCVPRCTAVGAIGTASGGCTATEVCIADHAGASYGSCDAVDRFCGEPDLRSLPAASTDCATGWVCDELLAGVTGMHETLGDGHCAPACTSDTDCTGRGACVTTGIFAGLCRTACTSDAACTAPQVCDVAQGWCVEGPPPA